MEYHRNNIMCQLLIALGHFCIASPGCWDAPRPQTACLNRTLDCRDLLSDGTIQFPLTSSPQYVPRSLSSGHSLRIWKGRLSHPGKSRTEVLRACTYQGSSVIEQSGACVEHSSMVRRRPMSEHWQNTLQSKLKWFARERRSTLCTLVAHQPCMSLCVETQTES